MKIDIDDTAKQIARDIFTTGDERGSPTTRIQFMAGHGVSEEKSHGGLCETALAMHIKTSLKKILST